MSENTPKITTKISWTSIVIVLSILNTVPSTIFTAFTCKVVWNMFSGELYQQITIYHALPPLLVINLLLARVITSVDAKPPERSFYEHLGHVFTTLLKPYLLGCLTIMSAYLLRLFV